MTVFHAHGSAGWGLTLPLAAALALAACDQPTNTAPPVPEASDADAGEPMPSEPMPSEPATDTGTMPPESGDQAPAYPPSDGGDGTSPPDEGSEQPPPP